MRQPPSRSRRRTVPPECYRCRADRAARWRAANPERHRQTIHTRYLKNRDKLIAQTKAWRAKNRDYAKARAAAWAKKNPEKTLDMYRRKRAKQFGLTLEQYDAMHSSQKGCCAICQRHESNFKRRLAIDHDHESGNVRQLLCIKCNVIIGHTGDSIEILEAAIAYLVRHGHSRAA